MTSPSPDGRRAEEEPMNPFVRAWTKVHQPRVISSLYCVIYTLLLLGGISALIDPPRSIEGAIGASAMTTLALLLVLGGSLGAPSALLGAWWLERIAVLSIGVSAGIYGVIIGVLDATGEDNRQLQLSMVLVVLLMQAVRWHRIRQRPYDPARH